MIEYVYINLHIKNKYRAVLHYFVICSICLFSETVDSFIKLHMTLLECEMRLISATGQAAKPPVELLKKRYFWGTHTVLTISYNIILYVIAFLYTNSSL